MPCLNISTNVNLDGVDTSAILAEATSAVAKIIGKPESMKGAAQSYLSWIAVISAFGLYLVYLAMLGYQLLG